MSRIFLAIAALFVIAGSGCAPALPRWRQEAAVVLDAARLGGSDMALPDEYLSAQSAFMHGEALLREGEVENAEESFRLAWLKGKLLEKNHAAEKMRRAEEARRRILEEKQEMERRRAGLEERRRAELEKSEAAAARTKPETPRQPKERSLPTHHTVKHGETLPQIAARSEVYNDYRLWPLLYRANRDQIRDPRHLWPGQVLRIPRNLSRDEFNEARRYAQDRPI